MKIKHILTIAIAFFTSSITFAQNQFEVLKEGAPGEKTFKGIISREVIQNDSSFKWYAENLKGYKPNQAALEGFKNHKDSVQLIVFMGTWCEDSHNVIPKFYALLDLAEVRRYQRAAQDDAAFDDYLRTEVFARVPQAA